MSKAIKPKYSLSESANIKKSSSGKDRFKRSRDVTLYYGTFRVNLLGDRLMTTDVLSDAIAVRDMMDNHNITVSKHGSWTKAKWIGKIIKEFQIEGDNSNEIASNLFDICLANKEIVPNGEGLQYIVPQGGLSGNERMFRDFSAVDNGDIKRAIHIKAILLWAKDNEENRDIFNGLESFKLMLFAHSSYKGLFKDFSIKDHIKYCSDATIERVYGFITKVDKRKVIADSPFDVAKTLLRKGYSFAQIFRLLNSNLRKEYKGESTHKKTQDFSRKDLQVIIKAAANSNRKAH